MKKLLLLLFAGLLFSCENTSEQNRQIAQTNQMLNKIKEYDDSVKPISKDSVKTIYTNKKHPVDLLSMNEQLGTFCRQVFLIVKNNTQSEGLFHIQISWYDNKGNVIYMNTYGTNGNALGAGQQRNIELENCSKVVEATRYDVEISKSEF